MESIIYTRIMSFVIELYSHLKKTGSYMFRSVMIIKTKLNREAKGKLKEILFWNWVN